MQFIIVALIVIAAIWFGAYIIDALISIAFAVAAFGLVYWIVKKVKKSKRESY